MILTVDIGNSRIKCALWNADDIVDRYAAPYRSDELFRVFEKLFAGMEKPSHVYAVCVAGEKLSLALSEWVRDHWGQEVMYLKTEKQYRNIVNAYEDPGRHGADRWAAVIAAHLANQSVAVCVISAGTAITFDFVNKTGNHLGGYIIPSFTSMRTALLKDTADVESTGQNTALDKLAVPDNTDDAVKQGIHILLQAGIRELCQIARQTMGQPMRIIITGGFAKNILAYPDMPEMHYEQDLVMQGLYEVMKKRFCEGY
jgi:type III pantothenate kinase